MDTDIRITTLETQLASEVSASKAWRENCETVTSERDALILQLRASKAEATEAKDRNVALDTMAKEATKKLATMEADRNAALQLMERARTEREQALSSSNQFRESLEAAQAIVAQQQVDLKKVSEELATAKQEMEQRLARIRELEKGQLVATTLLYPDAKSLTSAIERALEDRKKTNDELKRLGALLDNAKSAFAWVRQMMNPPRKIADALDSLKP